MQSLITESIHSVQDKYRSRITELRSSFHTPRKWIFLDGYSVIILILFFPFALGCGSPSPETPPPTAPLFNSLSPERTGITFANNLMEHPSPHRNQLLYEYFTNGGGVAIGDLNSDGLEDIYFSGNMMFNQLYLNRGGLVFDDITEIAGVGGRKNTWKTGVTIADVNGDGLLDIYACYSGDLPMDRRVDELFINQGNDEAGIPRFAEMAADYGLANPHSSNQGYFFDYDRDGDLDLFLQTHNVKNVPRLDPAETAQVLKQEDRVTGNRFYRNDGERFQDVTLATGISSSSLTYGLGAGVADFNKDGWMDIYVGNDYSPPDYLYINNGDGTFTDHLAEQMGHTSHASMGIDASDINNDGWADIMVVDMLPATSERLHTFFMPEDRDEFARSIASGFHRQYLRNTLQLNNGNGTFSEVGQLAGIHATDWSWAPLVADFDNDGQKDIFISNGILNNALDRDYLAFKRNYVANRQNNLEPNDVAYLMSILPKLDLKNYAFQNLDELQFENVAAAWGLDDALISTGAAYADLDNDGDLEIVLNNLNAPASLYENRSVNQQHLQVELKGNEGNTGGIGANVTVFVGASQQFVEQMPARGYLSSVGTTLHFGLGEAMTADSVHVIWPDGSRQMLYNVVANQRLVVAQSDARNVSVPENRPAPIFIERSSPLEFTHTVNSLSDDFVRQPLLDHMQSDVGPAMASADVNGDGLADIYVGGGEGQSGVLFLQTDEGTFVTSRQPAIQRDVNSHDVAAVFFDANEDGDVDLYVGSGGYAAFTPGDSALQDRLYLNDGAGQFQRVADALPEALTSTGTVVAGDVNDDGYLDLFVGSRVMPGRYPETPRSYLLINDGTGRFDDQTDQLAPALTSAGMVTTATWHDLNKDGDEELIIAGLWMPIRVFSKTDGQFVEVTDTYFDQPLHGLWQTMYVADLNADGLPDIVAGNLGTNSRLKVSPEAPATMYYADLDNNGSIDPLLTHYVESSMHFYAGLDQLRQQVPVIGAQFSNYNMYAVAQTGALQEAEILQGANKLSLNHLKTTLLLGTSEGKFEQAKLPVEAQFSPVSAIAAFDTNQDGHEDLVLAGNTEDATIRWGRHDAGYGVLLLGDSNGDFKYVSQQKSGLRLNGSVRSLLVDGGRMLVGTYRGQVRSYVQSRHPEPVEGPKSLADTP